jgi:hypothetical protein
MTAQMALLSARMAKNAFKNNPDCRRGLIYRQEAGRATFMVSKFTEEAIF